MKIDFVTPRFYPSVGGIEESVFQLARGLQRRGHVTIVHTMQREDWVDRERLQGIEIRRYPATMEKGYYVSRFEPDLRGDVVHMHAYAHQTNDWIIEHRAGTVPLFLSTHHGARFPKTTLKSKLYHAWYNRTRGVKNLQRLDGLLVPTGYDAEYFADQGVPANRVLIVPSGADEAAFQPQEPWKPPEVRDPFLLYVGRFHKEKGTLDLLAAQRLSSAAPTIVLAGRDEGALQGMDRGELAARNVHVVSPISHEQRFGLLAASAGLVLPSHYEGQGIVVAEAWAQGKPVIASRGGALPWVVDDGHDGLLFPVGDIEQLADAMRRLLGDSDLRQRLGERGRLKADALYRWPRIVQRVESLYFESLGKTRRA